MPTLAVALNCVSNIPEINPFFYGHLTKIAPGNTVVISFEKNDSGLSSGNWPAIELERSKLRLPFKLSRVGWLWNLVKHGYHDALPKVQIDQVAQFLKEHQVEVVMAEDGHNGCAVLPACLKAGVPLYTHFHGADIGVGGRRWEFRASYKYLAKYGTGFIAPSNFLAEKLQSHGFPRAKTHVIHCGVNVDDFHPVDKKVDNLIVAIGRFIPKKAPHRTVEAFAKVLVTYPQAILEMIGDGQLLTQTKIRAKELGIENKVIFNSTQTENAYVRKRLAQAQIFVQHSVMAPKGDIEAFGITPVEAMACGVPVVVTRHNGFVETVVDGQTGFLTPEHDTDAMARAMKHLLSDHELRRTMGAKGRQRVVENFTDEMNIKKLQSLLFT